MKNGTKLTVISAPEHELRTRYPKTYNPFKRSEANGWKPEPGNFSRYEFEDLWDNVPWRATEKLDGTNIRISWFPQEGEISIEGRKANSQMHSELREHLTDMFTESGRWHAAFDGNLDNFPVVTFYGEGIGPGIQKGGEHYGDHKHFALFDVRVGALWLDALDVQDIARKMAIRATILYGETATLKEWCQWVSTGFHSTYAWLENDTLANAEGIIARPVQNYLTRLGERVSCKVKTSQLNTDQVKEWLRA